MKGRVPELCVHSHRIGALQVARARGGKGGSGTRRFLLLETREESLSRPSRHGGSAAALRAAT